MVSAGRARRRRLAARDDLDVRLLLGERASDTDLGIPGTFYVLRGDLYPEAATVGSTIIGFGVRCGGQYQSTD